MSSKKLLFSGSNNSTIITIDTTLGTGASFTIPTTGAGYLYDVDWGDGARTAGHTANASHTYSVGGVYQIEIFGDFPRFFFNNTGDRLKLKSVDKFKSNGWSDLQNNAFFGCSNFTTIASWNVGNVTTMYAMFNNCTNFNSDLSSWNVGNVTTMFAMFNNCTSLTLSTNIGNWDVSKCLDFQLFMWYGNIPMYPDFSLWNFNKNVFLDLFYQAKTPYIFPAAKMDVLLQKLATAVIGTGRTQTNKTLSIAYHQYTSAGKVYRDMLIADGWTILYGTLI